MTTPTLNITFRPNTNTPWTSQDDLTLYRSLPPVVIADLVDEFGMTATNYDGMDTLIIDATDGWCGECDEQVDTAVVIYGLHLYGEGADEVEWLESETVCRECGECVLFRDQREADDAARWDEGDRMYDAMRDEGW